MSIDTKAPEQPPTLVGPPLAMRDLTTLLVRHYGLHEGLYDLLIEFRIGTGAVGPKDNQSPGATIGVTKVGLVKATKAGVTTVDAEEVNPSKPVRRKKA